MEHKINTLLSEGYLPLKCIKETLTDNGDAKYYINTKGQIFSLYSYKIIKDHDNGKGYRQVCLTLFHGGYKYYKVHRLVAMTFLSNVNNLKDVNHINGVKSDNNVNNLEWTSHSTNVKHSYDVLNRINDVSHLKKRICKYDMNDKLIEEYDSLIEAANKNNLKSSNISVVCNNKIVKNKKNGVIYNCEIKTAGGFKWKYK